MVIRVRRVRVVSQAGPAVPVSRLAVGLLGHVELRRQAGDALPLPAGKVEALLSYLAFRPGHAVASPVVAPAARNDTSASTTATLLLSNLPRTSRMISPPWEGIPSALGTDGRKPCDARLCNVRASSIYSQDSGNLRSLRPRLSLGSVNHFDVSAGATGPDVPSRGHPRVATLVRSAIRRQRACEI